MRQELTKNMPKTIVICPTCGNSVTWQPASKFRPFCSERCKLIDTGNWATDRYAIEEDESFIEDSDGSVPS